MKLREVTLFIMFIQKRVKYLGNVNIYKSYIINATDIRFSFYYMIPINLTSI